MTFEKEHPEGRPDQEFRKLMGFTYIPVTEEACELVDDIAAEIIATEDRDPRRARDLIAFKDCVGRALGDFAITLHQTENDPAHTPHCRDYPKGNDHYLQPSVMVSRRNSVAVYKGLKRLGYIETVAKHSYDKDTGKGICETVGPRSALREKLLSAGVLSDPLEHFTLDRQIPLEDDHWPSVIVRKKGTKITIPGLEETKAGRMLRQEMDELNEFISGVDIKGTDLAGWKRIFVDDFNHGGRMYCQPFDDACYQKMNKRDRAKLMLNGLSVNELDLKASFLYFALSQRMVDLVERMLEHDLDDPYAIDLANDLTPSEQREVVKISKARPYLEQCKT